MFVGQKYYVKAGKSSARTRVDTFSNQFEHSKEFISVPTFLGYMV